MSILGQLLSSLSSGGPRRMSADEADKLIREGKAVLIDVREPDEWAGGVAKPAVLLSLSDLRGPRRDWQPFLEKHRDKELVLYCHSGGRSGHVARLLAGEGYRTANLGGYSDWIGAGLQTRNP